MVKRLFFPVLFAFFTQVLFGMVANPFLREVKQPDGKVIKVRYVGNEWENYLVDNKGKVLVRNKKGYWVEGGSFKKLQRKKQSSPLSVLQFEKRFNSGLKRGVYNKFKNDFEASNRSYLNFSDMKKSRVKGVFSHPVLVILVEFSDFTHIGGGEGFWANSFFGENGKTVRSYYKEVSYGKLDIVPVSDSFGENNGVVGWIKLPYPHPDTANDVNENNLRIASDAIKAADDYVDFSMYDRNGDGVISVNELSIFIVVAGYEASYSPMYHPSVWGHKFALFSEYGYPGVLCDGVIVGEYSSEHSKTGGYMEIGEWQQSDESDGHEATIGIMCHELAHDMFGIIDLYDIDYTSQGIGCFGLMGAGSWGMAKDDSYPGETPIHFCAWSKVFCGFLTPQTLVEGDFGVKSVETEPDVKKILTPEKGEYFLVENRQQKGFDRGLYGFFREDGGGLAVWHIIDNAYNNVRDFYRKVDLVSARRCGDMISFFDLGKREDLFYSGNNDSLTPQTLPSSDISQGKESRVSITDISEPSDFMKATLSYTPDTVYPDYFKTSSSYGSDSFVSIAVDNDRGLVFALNLQNGVKVYRINNNKLELVSKVDEIGLFVKCYYSQGYLYVLDAKGRCLIVDVQDETNPFVVSEIDYLYQSDGMAIEGDFLYISVSDGFLIVDVSDKENPKIVYEDYSFVAVLDIEVKGNALYLTSYSGRYIQNSNRGILIYDISDKTNPQFVKRLDTGDETTCAIVYNNYLFAGNGPDYLYDISEPLNPVFIKRLKILGSVWGIYNDKLFVSTLGESNGTFRCYSLSFLPDISTEWSVFKQSGCFGVLGDYLIFSDSVENSLNLALFQDFERYNIVVDSAVLGNYNPYSSRVFHDGNNFFRNDGEKSYGVQVNTISFSGVKDIPFDNFFVKDNVFYSFEYKDNHYFFKVFNGSDNLETFQYKGKADTDFKSVYTTNCKGYNDLFFVPGLIEQDDEGKYHLGVDIFDNVLSGNPVKRGMVRLDPDEFVYRIAFYNNYLYIATLNETTMVPDCYYVYTVSLEDRDNPVVVEKKTLAKKPEYLVVFPVYLDFINGKLFFQRSDATLDVFNVQSDGSLSLAKEIDFSPYVSFWVLRFCADGNYAYISTSYGVLKADISDLDNFKILKVLPVPYSQAFAFVNSDYMVSINASSGRFNLLSREGWEADIPVLDKIYGDLFIRDYCVDGDNVFYVSENTLVKLKREGDNLVEEKRVLKFSDNFDYSTATHSWSHIGDDGENIYVMSRIGKKLILDVFDKEQLNLISETFLPDIYPIKRSAIFGRDIFLVTEEDDGYYLKHIQIDSSFNGVLKGEVKLNGREADLFYSITKSGNYVLANNFFEDIYLVKVEEDGSLSLVKDYKYQGTGFLKARGDSVFLCGYGIKMYKIEGDNLQNIDCIFDNFSADDVYFDGSKLTTVYKNVLRVYRFEGGKFTPYGKYFLNPAVDNNFIEKMGDKFVLFDVINASRVWLVDKVEKPEITSFSADVLKGVSPLTVDFNAELQSVPENSVFEWDFDGDGEVDTTTQTPSVSFTYSKPGHYFPSFVVKTPDGVEVKSGKLSITVYSDKPLTIPLNFGNWYNSAHIVFANNESTPVQLNVAVKDSNGNEIDGSEITINGNGRKDVEYGCTDGFLEVRGDGDFSAFLYLEGDGRISSALVNRVLNSGFVIPHIAEERDYWDSIAAFSSSVKENFKVSTSCENISEKGFYKVMNVENLLSEDCIDSQNGWGKIALSPFTPVGDGRDGTGFEFFVKGNSDGAGFALNSGQEKSLIIPHIPEERDLFWTGIVVVNLSDKLNRVVFHFYYKNGMPCENDYYCDLKPYEKLKGTISDLFPDLPEGVVSGVIEGEYNISGCEIYGTYNAGIAGFPLDSLSSVEGVFPVFVKENNWNGLAVFNPHDKKAKLTLSLYAKDGSLKDQIVMDLNPYEHTQFVLKYVFQIEDGDTLHYSSDIPVSIIGVQGEKDYKTMNAIPIR